jgi:dihydroxyacetone kinase-like predicted kinase
MLFVNDSNAVLAARELHAMTGKCLHVVPTPDIVAGIAGLFEMQSGATDVAAIERATQRVRSARVFFAGKDSSLGGASVAKGKPAAIAGGEFVEGNSLSAVVADAVRILGGAAGGLVTLYYGGAQKEKDALRLSEELRQAFPETDFEYYYGGMKNAEYWISFDE